MGPGAFCWQAVDGLSDTNPITCPSHEASGLAVRHASIASVVRFLLRCALLTVVFPSRR